ncbi:efflux transporter outer membrane subunit [Aquella oligotrophica]|uniref:Efflux transporter outer membrane subunit n=1 Tax=Aquella oligotrophica TaxID=2067065 RepID=A0A2I7N5Y9_9NEIS|nr:TolC family protein [Aquella oligotrophica]AUR51884.1 hypothetical protein CUN60_06095 [Aquella oligotrophica]
MNSLKILIISTTTMFVIVGCSFFTPNYNKPHIEAPQSWRSNESAAQTLNESNFSKVMWWHKFNDAALDNLINQALDNNSSIQIAIGNILAAQGVLKKIKLNWVPAIYLGGAGGVGQTFNSDTRSNNPIVSSSVPSSANFYYYDAGLVPAYSINIFKQFRETDIAKANLSAAKYAKDAAQLSVISQVVGSYFTIIALKKELDIQEQIISDIKELIRLNKLQHTNGIISGSQLESSTQQLERAELQIADINNNIVLAENALQLLLNKNPNKLDLGKDFDNISLNNLIFPNLPSTVLLQRPDILQAEENLKAANADIGVAQANFFPHIYLTTPVGTLNSNTGQLLNPTGDFWVLQAEALMPIFNLGISGLIAQKKGQYYIAYYNYVQTVRQSFIDADNSISTYSKSQVNFNLTSKLLISSEMDYLNNYRNYKAGYMSKLDTLPTKITLDNSKIQLIKTKLQQLQALITLYQTFGGGYNYRENNSPKKFNDEHDI